MKKTAKAGRWLAVFLILMIMPAMLLYTAFSLPEIYQDSYYAELSPMTRRLYESQGKRLILLGGSSIAFGVDTALLQDLLLQKGFAYTVCPMGLYAAVGTSAMLSLTEGALREGDVVVLAVEPMQENLSTYFGATAFLKCAEADPSLILHLSHSQRQQALGNLLPVLQEKYGIVRSGVLPKAEGVYSRASFDDTCNMVYEREGNIMALGYDTASPLSLSSLVMEEDFAGQVNRFCRTAQERGAEVFISFSPMNASSLQGDRDEAMAACFDLFYTNLDCTVISNPYDYLMDSRWFYDSNFHLNTAGARVRTWHLALDLLAQLGCYEAPEMELPEMPSPVRKEVQESGDTEDVTVEETEHGEGCIITGLTERGRGKTVLYLPSSSHGRPVVSVLPDSFRGAHMLEEIHIPASLETLPEGLFSDCPALQRLVMEPRDIPLNIPSGSLDGLSSLKILVPGEDYSRYRDGYGCGENPWQKYLDRMVTY